jgi:pyridoxine 5-phosphate synthase
MTHSSREPVAHTAALSVNVNKYALLRNSRGQNTPDLLQAVDLCLASGAQGITVHPRRDQRHVRLDDIPALTAHLRSKHPGVELNIECENHPELIELVLKHRPDQVTLVPVTPGEVTSDHGWDLPKELPSLSPVVVALKGAGIRVSLFADADPKKILWFKTTTADRIELYTGPYAKAWGTADQEHERGLLFAAAAEAVKFGLGVNAGHDLDRHNLEGLKGLPGLLEVSIGHAQICRALEVGTTQSIGELLAALGR